MTTIQWLPQLLQLNMLNSSGSTAQTTENSANNAGGFSSVLASMLPSSSAADTSSSLPLAELVGGGFANNGAGMILENLLLAALSSETNPASGNGTYLNSPSSHGLASSSLSSAGSDGAAALPTGKTTAGPSVTVASEKTAATGSYSDIINQMAQKYDVDPKLIQSVIKQESGGNANATSAAGAQGLMQLMPGTARALGVTDPYDPEQNIEGGTKYLKELLDRFNGDKRLAVAAYNAGPGSVEKYNGIPPYSETQSYVNNVLSNYNSLT